MSKKNLKVLILVVTGLITFQAVSIGVLLIKNIRLRHVLSQKTKLITDRPKKVHLPQKIAGRVAIVLDDWGYNTKNVGDLFSIGEPITISILPNLPFSKNIAAQAKKNKVEIILHLPLEAHDSHKPPETGTIYTYMTKKDVLARLQSALDSVPGAKGVSNHMGSKATEDVNLMKLIFIQLKKDDLYFLDSLVTNNSVCAKVAGKMGIRFIERSIFLDNNIDLDYIKSQLGQLLNTAENKAVAVGIGHDRALTIKAVKEMLPEFKREGVKLVYLSELVEEK
jgi:polysaccharide deacetylase 2 family uncharacterized protein YibQ